MVKLLYGMSYLHEVVDAFTRRLLPSYRGRFEEIVRGMEGGGENRDR